jgi:HPt (histidine-containing phosphotransfer) domain-containing protein
VDRASLAQVSGNDAGLERQILADFRTANDADMVALREALERRDVEQVTHASHRIKGACRMVGATALSDVCERMEKAGRKNDWNAIAGERAVLEAEFERLNHWLAGA